MIYDGQAKVNLLNDRRRECENNFGMPQIEIE
jgi:hypothetical protein